MKALLVTMTAAAVALHVTGLVHLFRRGDVALSGPQARPRVLVLVVLLPSLALAAVVAADWVAVT